MQSTRWGLKTQFEVSDLRKKCYLENTVTKSIVLKNRVEVEYMVLEKVLKSRVLKTTVHGKIRFGSYTTLITV